MVPRLPKQWTKHESKTTRTGTLYGWILLKNKREKCNSHWYSWQLWDMHPIDGTNWVQEYESSHDVWREIRYSFYLKVKTSHRWTQSGYLSMIKYAYNTYDGRTQNIPSEDSLFDSGGEGGQLYAWHRMMARAGYVPILSWLMTEWPALEMLSIVVAPVLAKSLSW